MRNAESQPRCPDVPKPKLLSVTTVEHKDSMADRNLNGGLRDILGLWCTGPHKTIETFISVLCGSKKAFLQQFFFAQFFKHKLDIFQWICRNGEAMWWYILKKCQCFIVFKRALSTFWEILMLRIVIRRERVVEL